VTDPGRRRTPQFDSFLQELTDAVGDRPDAIQSAIPSFPDPVFQNDAKVIYHWPELVGLVLEELR
jgi:hypothetical protein